MPPPLAPVPPLLRLLAACVLIGTGGGLAEEAQAQIRPLPHADTTAGNFFGAAVALSGDRAIVGAPGEDGCGPDSGAAYVYERNAAGQLEAVVRLEPAVCTEGRFFGRAVALSGDRALVAAGGSADGATGYVGLLPNTAHLFERDGAGVWREVATFSAEPGADDGPFAAAVALDGDRAVVTASGERGRRGSGRAYVYEHDGGRWALTARLAPRRHEGVFGASVALEGDRLVATASPLDERGAGSVHVFEREGGGWQEAARLDGIAAPTVRVALAGGLMLVGHTRAGPNRSGEAVVYGRAGSGRWLRLATLQAGVPYRDGAFGTAVALSNGPAGPRALVAGYTEQLGFETNIDRVVYVFGYDAAQGWVRQQVVDLGAWSFGAAVAVEGRTALVGQASEHAAGAVYEVSILR